MADPFKATMAILGLLLVALFGAWLILGRPRLFSDSSQSAEPQASSTTAPASQPAIPPLDSAVPAKTETATFALG
jgi:hypothetical protein